MTALDESTHRPSSEQPLWRQGTLSDDEFERAALAITPSWELGLDAAPALAAPPPAAVTAGAFAAPSAAVNSMLAAVGADVAPASSGPTPTTTRPSTVPGVVPVEASMSSGSARGSEAPPHRPLSMRPPVARRDIGDAYEAPKRAGSTKVWAMVGGAMLLAGALFVGLAVSSSSTPEPTPESAAPAVGSTPVAPEPVAPSVGSTPVALPVAVAVPVPPPVAAPLPTARSHAPRAREPSQAQPQAVARTPRVRSPAPARPAAAPAPAPAPRPPAGAGFVTESPY